MTTFTLLAVDVARCNGFTCPDDRENCRRFTERSLGEWNTKWSSNPVIDANTCRHLILVKPAPDPVGQGVVNVSPTIAHHAV